WVMVVSPSSPRLSTLITRYSVRKILVNPRLGRRRCNGICPPSKPRIMREPERDPCPLWPRVEVLPMPLPMPRPTRLRLAVAPLGGRNVDKFVGTVVFSLVAACFYCSSQATRLPWLPIGHLAARS